MIILVKYFVYLTFLWRKILIFYSTSDPELVPYILPSICTALYLCVYGVKSHDTSETTTGVSQRSTVGTDLLPT